MNFSSHNGVFKRAEQKVHAKPQQAYSRAHIKSSIKTKSTVEPFLALEIYFMTSGHCVREIESRF